MTRPSIKPIFQFSFKQGVEPSLNFTDVSSLVLIFKNFWFNIQAKLKTRSKSVNLPSLFPHFNRSYDGNVSVHLPRLTIF